MVQSNPGDSHTPFLLAGISGIVSVVLGWLTWRGKRSESKTTREESRDERAFRTQGEIIDDLRERLEKLEAERDKVREHYEGILARVREERDLAIHDANNKQMLVWQRDREILRLTARVDDLTKAVIDLGGKVNGHSKPVDGGARTE